MLSLVLLLLGFFAVLSATMERDESRSQAVLQSVTETFGPVLGSSTAGEPFASSVGDMIAVTAIEAELRTAFATIARVGRFEPVDDGGIATIAVPAPELFVGDSAVTRQRMGELARALARALADPPETIGLTVEVRAGPNGSSGATALMRAGRIAEALIVAGVDPADIMAGRDEALADDVIFVIGWYRLALGRAS
jgi:hypothetical protein